MSQDTLFINSDIYVALEVEHINTNKTSKLAREESVVIDCR